ncbi:MAG: penicillin-binding transpeptidase domain-containing protein [Planctomycetota bacterium]
MLREAVPSMFHRRLILLAAVAFAGFGLLAAQAARLGIAQGAEALDAAERRLVHERFTPTVRGSILDRKGRVLARDRAAWDVLVDYRVLTGEADYSRAARAARERHRSDWSAVGRRQRERWIEAELPAFEAETAALWTTLASALGTDAEVLRNRGVEIVRTVQRRAGTLWDVWYENRRAELNRERSTTVDLELADVARPIEEMRQPHVIARGLTAEQRRAVARLAERYDGLDIEPSGVREYPYETITVAVERDTLPGPLRELGEGAMSITLEGVDTHIVGWLRAHTREDVDGWRERTDRDRRRAFRPGDLVGSSGFEAVLEERLRGSRGLVETRRDTGDEYSLQSVPGEDVRVTIDIMLQARVRAAMSPELGLGLAQPWHGGERAEGDPLAGAAAVLDIETGEVLALVSTPSFSREQLQTDSESLFAAGGPQAGVNRAIQSPYPPGSVIKPVILNAAVGAGVHAAHHRIRDDGHLLPNRPDIFRDWYFRRFGLTHSGLLGGPLRGDEAIARSSNIFFYTLGRALGPDRIVDWLARFGVGGEQPATAELGLASFPGVVGPDALELGEAILVGIGQGPIAWTPVHAADAYATIARRGVRVWPRLLADQTVRGEDLQLDHHAVEMALDGLDMVIHWQHGTARAIPYRDGRPEPIFNVPGVRVWGKSGTAEAAPRTLATGDGEPVRITGTHAWFNALVGPEGGRPRYAISVVMEHAGSGTRVSAPIVNQIIGALVGEGYL